MNAEIIGIGTEILLGHILNTNALYLSRKLASLGINVYYHSTVGDNPARLASLLKLALSRSDIIFTTGGLGSTVDDITLSTIARVCFKHLDFNKHVSKDINSYFKRKGLKKTPEDAVRQAYIPEGAIWFRNTVGTAPGIFLEHWNRVIIALPGPPRELNPMFEKYVMPYLKKKGCAGDWMIKTRTVKTTGLVESLVNKKVKGLLSMSGDITVGIYAHLGEVHLKVTAKDKDEKSIDKRIKAIEKDITRKLKEYIYGADTDTLEGVVGDLLIKKKKTLSTAESCTGGLVANRITNVSGSSKYFKMGITAYSNQAKEKLLSVSKESIKKYGAVSRVTASEMAKGIRNLAGTDISLGITGIAGPTGGTKKKPVGLVYVSIITGKKKSTKEFRFTGNREEIKWQSSIAALDLLRQTLSNP